MGPTPPLAVGPGWCLCFAVGEVTSFELLPEFAVGVLRRVGGLSPNWPFTNFADLPATATKSTNHKEHTPVPFR